MINSLNNMDFIVFICAVITSSTIDIRKSLCQNSMQYLFLSLYIILPYGPLPLVSIIILCLVTNIITRLEIENKKL